MARGVPVVRRRGNIAEPRHSSGDPSLPEFFMSKTNIIGFELGPTTWANVVMLGRIWHLHESTHRTFVHRRQYLMQVHLKQSILVANGCDTPATGMKYVRTTPVESITPNSFVTGSNLTQSP